MVLTDCCCACYLLSHRICLSRFVCTCIYGYAPPRRRPRALLSFGVASSYQVDLFFCDTYFGVLLCVRRKRPFFQTLFFFSALLTVSLAPTGKSQIMQLSQCVRRYHSSSSSCTYTGGQRARCIFFEERCGVSVEPQLVLVFVDRYDTAESQCWSV